MPQATLLRLTSSLISWKTCGGCSDFWSKIIRFLSFQIFHVVYSWIAATDRFWTRGSISKLLVHQSSSPSSWSAGTWIMPEVQLLTRSQTCLAKLQYKQRWAPVSGSWSHKAQTVLHGQCLGVFLALGVAALGPAAQGGSRVHHYQFLVSPSSPILHFCWCFRPSLGSVRSVGPRLVHGSFQLLLFRFYHSRIILPCKILSQ